MLLWKIRCFHGLRQLPYSLFHFSLEFALFPQYVRTSTPALYLILSNSHMTLFLLRCFVNGSVHCHISQKALSSLGLPSGPLCLQASFHVWHLAPALLLLWRNGGFPGPHQNSWAFLLVLGDKCSLHLWSQRQFMCQFNTIHKLFMLVLLLSAQLTIFCCTHFRQVKGLKAGKHGLSLREQNPSSMLALSSNTIPQRSTGASWKYSVWQSLGLDCTLYPFHMRCISGQAKGLLSSSIYWSNLSYPVPHHVSGSCCLCLRRRMVRSMVCASLSSGWAEKLPCSLGLCCFPATAGWEWCFLCQRSSSSTLSSLTVTHLSVVQKPHVATGCVKLMKCRTSPITTCNRNMKYFSLLYLMAMKSIIKSNL